MLLFNEDKLRAVAYFRHSAEDKQENSIENQRDALRKKTDEEDVVIVESFEDEGVSGLTFNRPGFQAMLEKYLYDPAAPKIDYILVYDASRFGRLQQISRVWRLIADLEDKNIRLGSVDRGIPRGKVSVVDTIMMTLDFAISGESSRIQSVKVSAGSERISAQGYSAGGTAPFGYVRVLLDEQRNRLGALADGTHKMISNQRVAFEPARDGSAEVVTRIFNEFVNERLFPADIAEGLNSDGILTAKKRLWNSSGIMRVLTNETYTGTRVYNKRWAKLKEKPRNNPPELWVRCPGAHEALIGTDIYTQAQERLYWLRPRSRHSGALHISNMQNYVWQFIDSQLHELNDDQKFYIKRSLPVLFSATYTKSDENRACFYVPSNIKRFDQIIACTVDPKEGNILTAAYLIDTNDMSDNIFYIVRQDDDQNRIKAEALAKAVSKAGHNVLELDVPWLMPELAGR